MCIRDRPSADLASNKIHSPAEGMVVSTSEITEGMALQCKGESYSIDELLFGVKSETATIKDGFQSTIYLSPANYHRVHSPCSGMLKSIKYIPGELIPVMPKCLGLFKGIFKRNERLVFEIELKSSQSKIFVVMVGSINVGKMVSHYLPDFASNSELFWSKNYNSSIQHWKVDHKIKTLDELGFFSFGSTVVLVCDQEATTELGFSGFDLYGSVSLGQSAK